MEVYYALQVGEQYRCSDCSFTTTDIKFLHFHMRQHTACGSYFFCNDTKTAYPRSRTLGANTQTELLVEITSSDIIRTGNGLRFIPEVDKKNAVSLSSSPNKTQKRRSKKKAQESVEEVACFLDDERDADYDPVNDGYIDDIQTAAVTATPTKIPGKAQNTGNNPLVEIPLSYKYMGNDQLLQILDKEEPDGTGKKRADHNYIMVHGEQKGVSTFDDGVSWNGHSRSSTKQIFAIDSEWHLTRIFKRGSTYTTRRLENKRKKYVLMDPQPNYVVTFQKSTCSLEGNNSYKRRITYLSEAPQHLLHMKGKSIVEYYMDISDVRKQTSNEDSQVNVTLPDCSKLKEMLYPGISKEVPDQPPPESSDHEDDTADMMLETGNSSQTDITETQTSSSCVSQLDISREEMPNSAIDKIVMEDVDQDRLTMSKATSFQFFNNEELVKVIFAEDESNDTNKHYVIRKNTKRGFQRIDEYGVWDTSSTSNVQYVMVDNEFKHVIRKDGKYCLFDKTSSNNQRYVALTPQPMKEDLLVLHRCSFRLKDSPVRKRETVTWCFPRKFPKMQNRRLIEYCSDKMDMPIQSEKANGQKVMISQCHKLRPCGPKFQKRLSTYAMDDPVKKANSYFTNEEILEKLIMEDINTRSTDESGRNYMVINNEKADGKKKFFLKDGCVWNGKGGTSTNQTFIVSKDNHLRGIMMRDGQWCIKKRLGGQCLYVAVEPQPGPKELITIHKYFTSLKSCPLYKKRISSVTASPKRLEFVKNKVIVEYYTESNSKNPLQLFKNMFAEEQRGVATDTSEQDDEERSYSLKRKLDDCNDEQDIDQGTEESSDQMEKKRGHLLESVSIELPVTDMFRTSQECWKVFTEDTPVQSVMCDQHTKDYVFIECEESSSSVSSALHQDGLCWDTTSTFSYGKQTHLLEDGKVGRLVVKKNGVYCFLKHDKYMSVYEPLIGEQEVITFHRVWVKLKSLPHVKKRITNITEVPAKYSLTKSRALIEYLISERDQSILNTSHEDHSISDGPREEQSGDSTNEQPRIKLANMSDDYDLDTDEIESESDEDTPVPSHLKEYTSPPTSSVYGKPTYTPPNLNRTFKSPRLQQLSVKKIKLEPMEDDCSDGTFNEGSPNKSAAKITPTKASKKSFENIIGNFDFPMSYQLMSTDQIFQLLLTEDGLRCLKDRPDGAKYAIVAVDWYADDRRRLLQDKFKWGSSSGTTSNTKYSLSENNSLEIVYLKDDKYHRKIRKGYGKTTYELLKPQPKEVVNFHRYWTKGKTMTNMVKRVSAVTESPERLAFIRSKVLVEYGWK